MSPQGLAFLKAVPTTWDETKVVDGYPGQFIVIARRSCSEWFIGGMNADEVRSVEISLDFLGPDRFKAQIIVDADEAVVYPDRIWEKNEDVTSTSTLKALMASGGGYVSRLIPAAK